MAKVKVSEFIKYVRSKVGSAYLWGGQGETVFGQIRKLARQMGQSEAETEQMLAYMESVGVKDIGFFDCSGLAVEKLLREGAIRYDMTADGFYTACTEIEKKDVRPGDMVFLLNADERAIHIGYVVDKNTVVHALNQAKGVIEEPLEKRKWKFGRPEFCLEYDLDEETTEEDAGTLKDGDEVTLMKAVSGYMTAADALAGKNAVAAYPSGTYYVFMVYGGAVNITRTKGVPGAWVVL